MDRGQRTQLAVAGSDGSTLLLRTGAFRAQTGDAATQDRYKALAANPHAPPALRRSIRGAATTAGMLAAIDERLSTLQQRLAWFGSKTNRRRQFTVLRINSSPVGMAQPNPRPSALYLVSIPSAARSAHHPAVLGFVQYLHSYPGAIRTLPRRSLQSWVRRQKVAQDWAARVAGAESALQLPPGRGKLRHRLQRAELANAVAILEGKPERAKPNLPAELVAAREKLPASQPAPKPERKKMRERGAKPTVVFVGDATMGPSMRGGPPAAQNVVLRALVQCAFIVLVWMNEAFSSSVR